MKTQKIEKLVKTENPLDTEEITLLVEATNHPDVGKFFNVSAIGGHYPNADAVIEVINESLARREPVDSFFMDLDGAVGLRDALDYAIKAITKVDEAGEPLVAQLGAPLEAVLS